jgi:hypothetical protein
MLKASSTKVSVCVFAQIRKFALLFAVLVASQALAQAPPPIPPIPDVTRGITYNITSSTPQVQVPFVVFGDCSDIQVQINNVTVSLPTSLWNCASASGTALASLPLPITDMVVNFTPALTSGTTSITGAWHPRNLTVPTASGINRREYEQAISTLIANNRELYAGFQAAGDIPLTASLASPPPIGSFVPNLGFFTTLTANTFLTAGLPGLTASVEGTGIPGLDNPACTGIATCQFMLFASPASDAASTTSTVEFQRDASAITGGTAGLTRGALWVLGKSGKSANEFDWNIKSELHNQTLATTNAQNVAVQGTVYKDTPTGGGQVSVSWGVNGVCIDNQVLANPTASCVGGRFSSYTLAGSGTDTGKMRIGAHIQVGLSTGTDTAVHIGRGLLFSILGNAVVDNMIDILGGASQGSWGSLFTTSGGTVTAATGIDFSNVTFSSGNGLLLPTGTNVCLNGASNCFAWDGTEINFASNPVTFGGLVDVNGGITVAGVTSGAAAATGNIGELKSASVASGSSVTMTNGTSKDIVTLSLTAGVWQCTGAEGTVLGTGTVTVQLFGGIGTTLNTLPTPDSGNPSGGSGAAAANFFSQFGLSSGEFNVSTTTTVHLVMQPFFNTAQLNGYGTIRCYRSR